MSDILRERLGERVDAYPEELATRIPRLVRRIDELWGNPEEMRAFFEDLMITDADREGFPPEIASEIFRLAQVYDELAGDDSGNDIDDPWLVNERQARKALDESGIRVSGASLFDASERRNAREVIFLCRAGVSPDERDERYWTPLMVAAFEGSEEVAYALVEFGADPNAVDRKGYGPLHWAAHNGYDRVTKLLLARGADVDATTYRGWSALLQAAARGHDEIVDTLLSHHAAVNLASDDGWTPLHKAVANEHPKIVRILLDHGADLLAAHGDGRRPLDIAKTADDPYVMHVIQDWTRRRLARNRGESAGGAHAEDQAAWNDRTMEMPALSRADSADSADEPADDPGR